MQLLKTRFFSFASQTPANSQVNGNVEVARSAVSVATTSVSVTAKRKQKRRAPPPPTMMTQPTPMTRTRSSSPASSTTSTSTSSKGKKRRAPPAPIVPANNNADLAVDVKPMIKKQQSINAIETRKESTTSSSSSSSSSEPQSIPSPTPRVKAEVEVEVETEAKVDAVPIYAQVEKKKLERRDSTSSSSSSSSEEEETIKEQVIKATEAEPEKESGNCLRVPISAYGSTFRPVQRKSPNILNKIKQFDKDGFLLKKSATFGAPCKTISCQSLISQFEQRKNASNTLPSPPKRISSLTPCKSIDSLSTATPGTKSIVLQYEQRKSTPWSPCKTERAFEHEQRPEIPSPFKPFTSPRKEFPQPPTARAWTPCTSSRVSPEKKACPPCSSQNDESPRNRPTEFNKVEALRALAKELHEKNKQFMHETVKSKSKSGSWYDGLDECGLERRSSTELENRTWNRFLRDVARISSVEIDDQEIPTII